MKGKKAPTGPTQFVFQAGGFRFNSKAYEWLVVSGARALYQGRGTINGKGDYGFLLTAVDGRVTGGGGKNRLRLKVWKRSTGAIVYDNQPGAPDSANPTTVITGGGIVIHK